MKTTPIRMTAIAVALAAAFPVLAHADSDSPTLNPVIVTANGIPTKDSDATYASEVHDRAEIQASGAASLYDFLAQHTALNVQSSYGNKNAPVIDLRGYGAEAGNQNIVVVVDGYRLNNIDQSGQLIGSIPLEAIESIEISKGSGSVGFGDGAMAGVIQIHTRQGYNGATVSAMTGSRGAQDIGVNLGLSRELFDLTVSGSDSKQPSLSAADNKGLHDGSDNRNGHADLTLKPVSGVKLFLGGGDSHVDTRYVSSLTAAQFNANPGQAGSSSYTNQIYDSTQWRAGGEYEFLPGNAIRYVHDDEDKSSQYVGSPQSNYRNKSDDLSFRHTGRVFDLNVGVQDFKGERTTLPGGYNPANLTTKKNTAVYAQGVLRIQQWSFSAGARREKVEYAYLPVSGTANSGDYRLNAWDLGANYRFNEQWSGFANFNQGFQAPDIDRFFDASTGAFNGFIAPAKVKTVTVGANWDTQTNRLRVDVFHSKLHDEIYYNPVTYANTNIDSSHKYGLEFSDRWQTTDRLALTALYSYTRAFIDDGTYAGKELPGVPHHAATLGANYKTWENASLNVNQTWRSSAYMISNFANNEAFRQTRYNATSVSLRQRWKTGGTDVEGFVAVDNLFDQKNGLWVYSNSSSSGVVYPVDFRRTARVGVKIGF